MAMDAHQDAGSKPKRDKGCTAIAQEREGYTNYRQKASNHADIDKGIGEKDHGNRTPQKTSKQSGRLNRDRQATYNQCKKE